MQARFGRSVATLSACGVVTAQRLFVRETFFSGLRFDVSGGDFFTIDGTLFVASISSSDAGKTFFLFATAAAPWSLAAKDLSRVASWESITRKPFTIGTNFCSGAESCVGERWGVEGVGLADEWE